MSDLPQVQQDSPVKAIFERDDVQRKFQEMLGKKSTGFIVSVINAVTNDKNLAQADRNSILFAAATAAALDLPINANLGFAYIVPYKTKKKIGNTWQEVQLAQFQMGYKGFIQLAMRTGEFKTLGVEIVYESDDQDSVRERIDSMFTKIEPEGKPIGFLGYFKLLNGFEKTLYMSIEDLKKHGLKYSQSFKSSKKYVKENSLWSTDFESMATKTVIKLLLSKYAPLSIEMQRAVNTDQAVINDWDGSSVEYPDNKKITLEETQETKEYERIKNWIESAESMKELEKAKEHINSEELMDLYYEREVELNDISK